jgi:hypothetical protein
MVEFRVRIHPRQKLAYIPRELAEILGQRVKAVPNRGAVLFYPESADPKIVLESLDIIKRDLELGLLRSRRR